MCDPWGVPRMLNGQVAGPHSTVEIIQLPERAFLLSQWQHDYRMVRTDGISPTLMKSSRSGMDIRSESEREIRSL